MPNWCSNNLHMEGDAEEIGRFKDTHNSVPRVWNDGHTGHAGQEKETLDFSASVWDEDNDVKEYSGYGYSWQNKYWGTKWNACEVDYHGDGHYSFETAWSPPEAWLVSMSAKFPELKFMLSYSEPGMGFMGITVAIGGDKIFDTGLDMDESRDIIKANLSPEQEKKLKDLDEDDRWDFYDEHMYIAWNELEGEAGVN